MAARLRGGRRTHSSEHKACPRGGSRTCAWSSMCRPSPPCTGNPPQHAGPSASRSRSTKTLATWRVVWRFPKRRLKRERRNLKKSEDPEVDAEKIAFAIQVISGSPFFLRPAPWPRSRAGSATLCGRGRCSGRIGARHELSRSPASRMLAPSPSPLRTELRIGSAVRRQCTDGAACAPGGAAVRGRLSSRVSALSRHPRHTSASSSSPAPSLRALPAGS